MLADSFSELIVLSHLRWEWVWQRPQHLIARVGAGLDTTFVEEPVGRPGRGEPQLGSELTGSVRRTWLEVGGAELCGFDDPRGEDYGDLLLQTLPPTAGRVVWLYTAMALDLAERLQPDL